MSGFVYDAAVLVAADRNDRRCWAEHRARLELGFIPLIPSPVVAQVSRSPRQANLRRFLRGCSVIPFGEGDAHETGRLLGVAGSTDVVDGFVAAIAARHDAVVLTADIGDIERLARATGRRIAVVAV